MTPTIVITLTALLFAIALAAAAIYNGLVRRRNLVDEAFSGIDVQLRRRHDLVPALAQCVAAYRDFESNTLVRVTELRSSAHAADAERADLENQLAGQIQTLLATAEAHPDLKASEHYADLMTQLADVEDQLQHARRYYNGAVRDYHTALQSFPQLIVANLFGFTHRVFFEVTPAVRRTPSVTDRSPA